MKAVRVYGDITRYARSQANLSLEGETGPIGAPNAVRAVGKANSDNSLETALTDHIARAETTIAAPADGVWRALTDPALIQQYMMGATVTSDWNAGSAITWKGEFKGKPFEDRGAVKRAIPNQLIEYTHFSPMEGKPDAPENYHMVTVQLAPDGTGTRVSLSQTNNPTDEARKHSEENWNAMLADMKKLVEGK